MPEIVSLSGHERAFVPTLRCPARAGRAVVGNRACWQIAASLRHRIREMPPPPWEPAELFPEGAAGDRAGPGAGSAPPVVLA